ncbi:MAG: alpha/beta hydrolase fold domain-containing protein [Rhodospirillales bacterium]|nr:alpha/beta hydrolase fold domain-containing protein [Rhodospirillales bacterium]
MVAWQTLSPEARERAYSPSSAAPGFMASIARYRQASDAARAAYRHEILTTGDGQDCVALFPGERPDAPLHVFIHGGYWQELGWEDSLFAAPAFLAAGIAFAAIGYTLAPAAGIDQIMRQCHRALDRLAAIAPTGRTTLSGHSAGAHLAAMLATERPVAGVALVSGIYDLAPLPGTSINTALGLTAVAAQRLSPAHRPPPRACPAVIAWAAGDTAEFRRQSRDFVAHWRGGPNPVQAIEVPGRDHFDLVLDLAAPSAALGRAALGLAGRAPPPR